MEDRRNSALLDTQKDASNRLLKAKNPNLYYKNSHMEYYYFCQQCKDYFETASIKGHKHVFFAAFFLKDSIFFCWQ